MLYAMPRVARIVIPGLEHHITQRGNNRQDVFFVDDDRRVYLGILKKQAAAHGLKVISYCLMTSHVHVVGIPRDADSMAKAIGRTNFLYAQYINRFHGRSGHLWQNRFHSCALDQPHLAGTLCYVERNPVRARLVRHAWQYEWSSAAAHLAGKDATGLLDMAAWRISPKDWRDLLQRPDDPTDLDAIRRQTSTGRPLATDTSLSKLEKMLGKRLRPLPGGRPRKKDSSTPKQKGQKRERPMKAAEK